MELQPSSRPRSASRHADDQSISFFAWCLRIDRGGTRGSKEQWPIWDMRSGAARSPTFSREYGVDPAPERDKHMPWSTFLRAHRECLVATDFLTVEVCTIRGLVTHDVLFFIDIVNRAVKIAG